MSTDRDTLTRELMEMVAQEGMVEPSEITPQKKLEELDIQSADFVMILMAIEEKYGAYVSVDNELTDVVTVQDLLDLAISKIEEHQAAEA
ncbi:phosphopantetheine-binding protein [Shimia sagamensis]|uniref:Acyl carrier protein n=1 Tax=Shimia sagamensis TaxID=1566352 RepID=A0ABY1PPB9_9RHOB|nr:phosphopantetheine-binding protein [Shimia sagamensis]SMP36049.1 acyl carrier protein [Shimia sagamensis]